jgi:uncharacterized membrane protein
MKESKKFFDKDNRLNKGHSPQGKSPRNSDKYYYRKKFESIMPPADIIQAYEDINEGAFERIMSLAESEQEHRHAIEKTNLHIYERSRRIGQLFALFTVIVLCYTILQLTQNGYSQQGMIVAICGFGSIAVVSLLSYLKTAPSGKDNSPIKRGGKSSQKGRKAYGKKSN